MKKTYIKPETALIEFAAEAVMQTASGETNPSLDIYSNVELPDDAIVLSKDHGSSLWDED